MSSPYQPLPSVDRNASTEIKRKLPSGPVFLFPQVRKAAVHTISDQELRHAITVTVSHLAGMARQNELDVRAFPTNSYEDPQPKSWQDVCDWLLGIVGREGDFPERESSPSQETADMFAAMIAADAGRSLAEEQEPEK